MRNLEFESNYEDDLEQETAWVIRDYTLDDLEPYLTVEMWFQLVDIAEYVAKQKLEQKIKQAAEDWEIGLYERSLPCV